MHETHLADARAIVAGVLGCRLDDVTGDTQVGSLPQWDSIAHLSIVMAFEERLGHQLTAEDIGSLETVASFAVLLAADDERMPGA